MYIFFNINHLNFDFSQKNRNFANYFRFSECLFEFEEKKIIEDDETNTLHL